jgi:hypothetical protein
MTHQDPPLPRRFDQLMFLDQEDFKDRGPGGYEIALAEAEYNASKHATAGEAVFVRFNPDRPEAVEEAMSELFRNPSQATAIHKWWTSTMSEKVPGKGEPRGLGLRQTTRRDLRIKNQEKIVAKQAKQRQQQAETRRRATEAASRPPQQVAHPRQEVDVPQSQRESWDAPDTRTVYSCPWGDGKFDDIASLDKHVLAKHWDLKTNKPKAWDAVESSHQGIILKFFQDQFAAKSKAKKAPIADEQFAGGRK